MDCRSRFSALQTSLPALSSKVRKQMRRPSRSPDLRLWVFALPSQGICPNDRLSPRAGQRRIQWRYRSGFRPDSLFSPCPHTGQAALERMLYFKSIIIERRAFVNRKSLLPPFAVPRAACAASRASAPLFRPYNVSYGEDHCRGHARGQNYVQKYRHFSPLLT